MKAKLPIEGERIVCVRMAQDPDPIPSGSLGTVLGVCEVLREHHIIVKWDSGRTLNLVHGLDVWAPQKK